jgi:hypothetical protein
MTAGVGERTRWIIPADPQRWFRDSKTIRGRHPAAVAVQDLIPPSACTVVSCPHCPVDGGPVGVLDHLLSNHACSLEAAAEWLETIDPDLFCLAVHHLASQARTPTAEPATATTRPL